MKKIILILLTLILITVSKAYADSTVQTAINSGINYLGTQLNGATGQIKNGSTGDATPWAAIAFSANGTDPSTVKSSDGAPSLVDYLKANPPTTSSAATEWEKWILAIVASNQNPYNFGGLNYVSTLESSTYYHDNQLGDTTSVTDDWFGVMALIASGVDKTNNVLTDSLSFIVSHQNSDGGFGYSTTAGSDGNDTAAAIQALVDAQNYGVNNASLSAALSSAKTYLLSTQDKSGGFLYDTNPWTTAPDSDSTTWAIMALNALGMQNSTEWNNATSWLISQQSKTDSGFTACNNWDANGNCIGYASNSTTTSHALIGLAGKGWVFTIFNAASATPAPTTSILPTLTPTPTQAQSPTPIQSGPTSTPTSTPTPIVITNTNTVYVYPTSAPQPTQTPQITYVTNILATPTPTPTPLPGVLGITTNNMPTGGPTQPQEQNQLPTFFTGMGSAFLAFYLWSILVKFGILGKLKGFIKLNY